MYFLAFIQTNWVRSKILWVDNGRANSRLDLTKKVVKLFIINCNKGTPKQENFHIKRTPIKTSPKKGMVYISDYPPGR